MPTLPLSGSEFNMQSGCGTLLETVMLGTQQLFILTSLLFLSKQYQWHHTLNKPKHNIQHSLSSFYYLFSPSCFAYLISCSAASAWPFQKNTPLHFPLRILQPGCSFPRLKPNTPISANSNSTSRSPGQKDFPWKSPLISPPPTTNGTHI